MVSILAVLAVGQTLVVLTRNVDLSVGSTLGLTAYLTGQVFIAYPSLPYPFVFLIGLAFGGMLGVVNGVLVAVFKVPALVITLGTPSFSHIEIDMGDIRSVLDDLLHEHRLVHPGDLSKLDAAFFTVNGVISIVFLGFVLADVLL